MMRIVLASLMLALGSPAIAQTAPQPSPISSVDPARLEIGRRLAFLVMPDGTYRKIMGPVMDGMMGPMANSFMTMPVRDIARMGGLDEQKLQAMGPGSLREIAEIVDPAFQQRTQISMKVITGGMIDIISQMEPDLRDGVAEAYARAFTLQELEDVERFFRTPSGKAYAERAMLLAADPGMMKRAQAIMPKMMEAMPALMKKVEAATADLPKRRTADELTADEKKRISVLLGTDPAKVKS